MAKKKITMTISEAVKNLKESKEKQASLSAELEALNAELAAASSDDEKSAKQAEIEAKKAELDGLKSGVQKAKEDLDAVIDDIKTLSETQEVLDSYNNSFKDSSEELVTLTSTEEELDDAQKAQKTALEVDIDALKEIIKSLASALKDKNDKIKDKAKNVNETNAQKIIDKLQAAYDDINKKYNDETVPSKKEKLKSKLDQARYELEDAKSVLATVKRNKVTQIIVNFYSVEKVLGEQENYFKPVEEGGRVAPTSGDTIGTIHNDLVKYVEMFSNVKVGDITLKEYIDSIANEFQVSEIPEINNNSYAKKVEGQLEKTSTAAKAEGKDDPIEKLVSVFDDFKKSSDDSETKAYKNIYANDQLVMIFGRNIKKKYPLSNLTVYYNQVEIEKLEKEINDLKKGKEIDQATLTGLNLKIEELNRQNATLTSEKEKAENERDAIKNSFWNKHKVAIKVGGSLAIIAAFALGWGIRSCSPDNANAQNLADYAAYVTQESAEREVFDDIVKDIKFGTETVTYEDMQATYNKKFNSDDNTQTQNVTAKYQLSDGSQTVALASTTIENAQVIEQSEIDALNKMIDEYFKTNDKTGTVEVSDSISYDYSAVTQTPYMQAVADSLQNAYYKTDAEQAKEDAKKALSDLKTALANITALGISSDAETAKIVKAVEDAIANASSNDDTTALANIKNYINNELQELESFKTSLSNAKEDGITAEEKAELETLINDTYAATDGKEVGTTTVNADYTFSTTGEMQALLNKEIAEQAKSDAEDALSDLKTKLAEIEALGISSDAKTSEIVKAVEDAIANASSNDDTAALTNIKNYINNELDELEKFKASLSNAQTDGITDDEEKELNALINDTYAKTDNITDYKFSTTSEMQALLNNALLSQENANLQSQINSANSQISDLNKTVNEKIAELEQKESTIEEDKAVQESLQSQIDTLKGTISSLEETYEKLLADKDSQISDKDARIAELEDLLNKANASLESANAANAELQTKLETAQKELDEVKASNATLQEENATLQGSIKELEDAFKELENENNVNKQNLEAAQSALAAVQTQLQAKIDEYNALLEKYNALQTSSSELETELAATKKQLEDALNSMSSGSIYNSLSAIYENIFGTEPASNATAEDILNAISDALVSGKGPSTEAGKDEKNL
jgi:hypothetical protein